MFITLKRIEAVFQNTDIETFWKEPKFSLKLSNKITGTENYDDLNLTAVNTGSESHRDSYLF